MFEKKMKSLQRKQAHRVRLIAGMIKAGIDGQKYPSAADIAAVLEVSWRTVMRDLDYLRDDEGAPVAYDASRKGYYFTSERWSLEPVALTEREVLAFALAAKMFQPFRGTPMESDLASLFAKVGRSVKGAVSWSDTGAADPVSFIADDYVPVDELRWSAMLHHIQRREVVRMHYRTFSGDKKEYEIAPVHLTAYHGNWYVLAYRRDKTEPATFALSRVIDMTRTDIESWAPRKFDAEAFSQTAFGITRGERLMKVHLRVSPNIATYVAERVWHPTQRLRIGKDGWLDLRFTTRGWKELVRWILSWQPDIHVIAPVDLRKRVQQKMKEGMRRSKSTSNTQHSTSNI